MALQEKVKKLTSKPVATVETFEIFQNWTYIYTENLFSPLRTISIKTIKNREKSKTKQKEDHGIEIFFHKPSGHENKSIHWLS